MELLEEYKRDIALKNKEMEQKLAQSGEPNYNDLLWYYSTASYMLEDLPQEKEFAKSLTKFVKGYADKMWQYADDDDDYYRIFWQSMLLEAPHFFESFLIYMERKRPFEKRFYEPRSCTLKTVVNDLQDLEDDKLRMLSVSMPSRVGKSSTILFFLSWVMGKHPEYHNAMGTHSGILARHFYKELLKIIDTQEYCFRDIFPDIVDDKGRVIKEQSADEYTLQLYASGDFPSMTCRGIDGTWTGAVDISKGGYLCVDDLVRDREHSLSPIRMENTYQEYQNKMLDRMNDGAKLLLIGTLWSVLDPISKEEQQFANDPKCRFRKIPALNENDESNFQYDVKGFSTEYYRNMRARLDDAEWQAKFQQAPYVREGLVFPTDELRYFNGILPEGDSRVVAVIDIAWGGGDSLSMPIGREYDNGDIYIFDWVFNTGSKEETIPLVTAKIVENEIRQVRCEGNVGGAMYSSYIDEKLQALNYKCNCTEKKAPTKMSKVEKILAYSGDIKRKFVFLAPNGMIANTVNENSEIRRYRRSSEYQKAMDELCMFVSVGKNPHDDAADGLTQLAMFCSEGKENNVLVLDRSFLGF